MQDDPRDDPHYPNLYKDHLGNKGEGVVRDQGQAVHVQLLPGHNIKETTTTLIVNICFVCMKPPIKDLVDSYLETITAL